MMSCGSCFRTSLWLIAAGLFLPGWAWAQADITDEDGDGIRETCEVVTFTAHETRMGHPCLAYTWTLYGLDGIEGDSLFVADERIVAWSYAVPGWYFAELTQVCEMADPENTVTIISLHPLEIEPASLEDDLDGDGVADECDNCPDGFNPDQSGADDDLDGRVDACDNCDGTANSDQSNCDPQWDQRNPEGFQGDACDPDPCPHYLTGGLMSVLRDGAEDLGNGHIVIGSLAEFAFDAMGGRMQEGTLTFPADGSGDSYSVDVAARYCSCRHAEPGLENCQTTECREDGVPRENYFEGTGWLHMTRREGGAVRREQIPDVPFQRGGGSLGSHMWEWQGDECPAAVEHDPHVDCVAVSEEEQRFRLWVRPLVDDASWPTGWPFDEHNFYNAGEESMSVRILPHPPEEAHWPGPRLIPEGPCYECGMEFFAEDLLPILTELNPDYLLPEWSPYRFDGFTSGDPVQGLAVALLDSASLAPVAFVPSEGVTPSDEPRVTRSLACVAPTAADAELWLFGGLDGAGVPSSGLFRGITTTPEAISWERKSPSGATPPGRTDGLLAFDPLTESLVLHAGVAGTSTLEDVWRFDVLSETWEEAELAHFGGAAPGARHSFAHAQSDGTVFFYGGMRADGSRLSDLCELDLATLTVRSVSQDLSAGGPGARAAAGLAVEVGAQSLLLFGGTTASGSASDLWRFDLGTHKWTRLARPCTGGACPPAGPATLLAGPQIGSAVLPAEIGPEAHPEPYWHFEAGRAAAVPGWISAGGWRSSPAAADCNDDAAPDPGLGYACATSASWYGAVSSRACDRLGSQLACPQITTTSTGTTLLSAPTPAALAARDGVAVFATGNTVKRVRLVAGQTPSIIATASLTGTARSVVLDGQLAFVGSSVGVEVYSLAGIGLVKVGQKTLSGGASAMAGDGVRLYVAQGMTFRVYDSASAALPQLGSTTLALSSTPTTATVAGDRVLVAGGTKVAVVSVATPTAPAVVGVPSVGGTTSAIRGRGQVGYGVLTSGGTYVLDVTGTPALAGTHDVTLWARGATHLARFALRLNGANLEVAALAP